MSLTVKAMIRNGNIMATERLTEALVNQVGVARNLKRLHMNLDTYLSVRADVPSLYSGKSTTGIAKNEVINDNGSCI